MKPTQAKLFRLVQQAEARPGEKCTTLLSNNLQVDVRIDGPITHLQISRSSRYPTLMDWHTVVNNFPYVMSGATQPRQARDKETGRHYLRSRHLTPMRLEAVES